LETRNRILFWVIGSLGLVVLLFVILYFSAPRIINSEIVKKEVSAFFNRKTGGSIVFEKSDVHLFPVPHINFQQVSISVPDKADGLIQFLDIYPDIWSLIRGDVKFSKLEIESPRFIVAVSEEIEKTSLEQIEVKIQSLVNGLTSIVPNLFVTVQEGKLDLTKRNRVAFSFGAIRSRLTTSGKSLNIYLTCTSNLWGHLSVESSLNSEGLTNDGTLQIKELRLHTLFAQLFPNIAANIGDSDTNLSAKFQALGLRQIKAQVGSSVPDLVLMRGKKRVEIKNLKFKGDLDIEPGRVSVLLTDFNSTLPGLKMSGKYTMNRASGIRDLDLDGKSIDVQSARKSALALGGDIPVVRDIFDIVQGGTVSYLHFSSRGKSRDDLGSLSNMRISGRMLNGDIYIRSRDLSFHNAEGDVVISKGILEGRNIEASIEGNRAGKGQLRVGLKGKDAPFYLDVRVSADACRLPSFLRQKHLIKNDAVLREIDRLSDTHGNAEGRLILGDRLDSVHAVVDISQINLVTRYERLPFPLTIKGGHVFFDEKSIKTTNLDGNMGNSLFTGLTAGISLDDKADFEMSSGQMTISCDEIYPWVTSFEKIRPVLKDIPSMKGTIMISSAELKGSLYQPKAWKYLANGKLKDFTLESAFFPGKSEETSGAFRVTDNEVYLKNVRTKMIDSHFIVSGTVSKFPADIRKVDLSLEGEIGPRVTAWISALIKLPQDMSVRAPLSISASNLAWEKDIKTTFDGSLVFGRETQVSIKLTKTPDELTVHQISIRNRESDVKASIMFSKKTTDIAFKGVLTSDTIKAIFAQSKFSGSSLQGDFTANIDLKDPARSVAEGVIAGKKIPVPWGYDMPMVVQNISVEARGKRVLVNSVQLLMGEAKFSGKGTIDTSKPWLFVDMDVSSNGFDFETVEKIVQGTKKSEGTAKTGFPENFPVKGILRIQSDFFKYHQFTWEPFRADVSFDGEKLSINPKRAVLCGISTTGEVDITANGAELDIALSAKEIELEPTVLCISDKRADITGKFQMKADLKAQGKFGAIAKSLNGSFSFSAKNGEIFRSRSIAKTLSLVNETEDFRGKLPDLDKTVISYHVLSAKGTIKENMVDVEEGILDASRFGILVHGQFDIETSTVDFNVLVTPVNNVQRFIGKIPVLGPILGGSLVSIPVKIKGNVRDPQVTFLSPSAVGDAFLGIIKRTIKLPVTIIQPVLPGKKQD
jgi:hypothetical protein